MAPTLPVELQLDILELAIPPLTLQALRDRRQLCCSFSLVHRTWTAAAQRALFSCALVDLRDRWTLEGATAAVQRLRKTGRHGSFRALEVYLSGRRVHLVSLLIQCDDAATVAAVEGLLERSAEEGLPLKDCPGIKRLAWLGGRNRLFVDNHTLPPSLDFLAIFTTSFRLFTLSSYPSLTTLVVSRSADVAVSADLLALLPNLSVLAWCSDKGASVLDLLANAPSLKLRRLLLEGAGLTRARLSAALHHPPKSITLINPHPPDPEGVEGWCREKGTDLYRMDQWEEAELDLELWALQ
ncbi:hypothetical protein JCM6882_004622 [Rhodosporidiobolus microsporus]